MMLSKKMIGLNKSVRWIGVSTNKSLSRKEYIDDLKFVINNSTEFSVRDKYSLDLLNCICSSNKIRLIDDLALNLQKKKTIIVTLIDFFNDEKKLVQFVTEIVLFCKNNGNCYQICFLPFFNGYYNDVNLIKRIMCQIDFGDVDYFVASEYKSVDDVILMVKGCDIMINMRYHASLLGLQYDKQVISICYDKHKHYFNKVNYIHEYFNNKNIISFLEYKNNDLYKMLDNIAKN